MRYVKNLGVIAATLALIAVTIAAWPITTHAAWRHVAFGFVLACFIVAVVRAGGGTDDSDR